jgi:predicted RNase H-related nuclease YkuK (DUF458 family)
LVHRSRRRIAAIMRRSDIDPKVFIGHASEDKERFLRAFATKLRQEAGVDAWVDEWEIYPGDSLVQKISEEGLKDAEAVIIVLSEHSVDEPWVREELSPTRYASASTTHARS